MVFVCFRGVKRWRLLEVCSYNFSANKFQRGTHGTVCNAQRQCLVHNCREELLKTYLI